MSDVKPFGPVLPSELAGPARPPQVTEDRPQFPTCKEYKKALVDCHTCACITCHKCCRNCTAHGERMN